MHMKRKKMHAVFTWRGAKPKFTVHSKVIILTWSDRLCSVAYDCYILGMAAVVPSKTVAGAVQEACLGTSALQLIKEDRTDPNSIQEDSIGCNCSYKYFT